MFLDQKALFGNYNNAYIYRICSNNKSSLTWQ